MLNYLWPLASPSAPGQAVYRSSGRSAATPYYRETADGATLAASASYLVTTQLIPFGPIQPTTATPVHPSTPSARCAPA